MAVAAMVATITILASCAPGQTPDPALVKPVKDALSATRAAQLGLNLNQDGRMIPGTAIALYGDMADALAESARTLELAATTTPADAAYRADGLDATRVAIEGVHDAQYGDGSSAESALQQAADELAHLAGGQ